MRKGILICFIGIDGSGKSTQAEMIFDHLSKRKINVVINWGRREPFLIKPITILIKKFLLREKGGTEGKNYIYIKKSRNKYFKITALRNLWINIALLDYFFKLISRIHLPLLKGNIVICDRYIHDAIADFAGNFNYNSDNIRTMLKNHLLRLFPKPTKVFYIDIPPEIGAKRKFDGTSIEYLKDRKRIYDLLNKEIDIIKVDGSKNIESVQKIILHELNSIKWNF